MAEKFRGDGVRNEEPKNRPVGSSSNTIYGEVNHKERSPLVVPSGEYTQKKKPTSFQITSVTVQGSTQLSNDAGEDSADDLDESHTEDMPSDRHSVPSELDNDQLSEASTITSSNSNNNINEKAKVSPAGPITETTSSPSIPAKVENIVETISNVSTSVTTSDSKVGVDIPLGVSLSTDFAGNMIASGGQHVTLSLMSSCTTSKSTVSSQVPMTSLPDQWQNRFKVVKLVSSEPFKRGRWVCMDFTNPPAVQRDVPKQEVSTEQSSTSGASSAGSSATSLFSENQPLDTVAHFYEIPVSQPYSVAGSISVAVDTPQNSQSIIYLPMNNQVYSAPQVPHMAVVQNFGIQSGHQIVTDSQQQNILSQQGQIVVKTMQNQTSQQQPQHPVQPGQMVPAVSQPLSQPIVQVSQTLPQSVVSQQQHPTPPTQPSSGPHTQSIGNIPDVTHSQASQTASSQDQNYQGPSQVTLATVSSDVSMPNVMTSVTSMVPPLLEVLPDTLTLGNKSIGDGEEAERKQHKEVKDLCSVNLLDNFVNL
ncbi:TSC22 domain family protein 1-like, partial [Limulus polyphemus]|uniref:TSC22 domain family protein 1-like n=1 Tax=Limulus polyphemus TaxID=6850 RepID=A0ABM1BMR6_LIMPO